MKENIINFIKDELSDNKTRLSIFLNKQSKKKKPTIQLENYKAIKLRIWRLEQIIKHLDGLNSLG
jgi:hypothetical protein